MIWAILVGAVAVVMGASGLRKGEIKFSRNTTLSGKQAKIVSLATIILGVTIIVVSTIILVAFWGP